MIMNWISTLGEKEDFTNIKLFFLYVLDMLILFLNYGEWLFLSFQENNLKRK